MGMKRQRLQMKGLMLQGMLLGLLGMYSRNLSFNQLKSFGSELEDLVNLQILSPLEMCTRLGTLLAGPSLAMLITNSGLLIRPSKLVMSLAVEESLRSVNLFNGGVADKQAGKYSGGMKRRFSVAISLIEEEVQCCHITNLVSLVFFNSCYFIINALRHLKL